MPDMPGPWGEAQQDAWEAQREHLGAFIRERRKQANLSLRQLAELTSLSNPYLSQIERGLHQPSVRVLQGHLRRAQPLRGDHARPGRPHRRHARAPTGARPAAADGPAVPGTEQAIRADKRLSEDQKSALIVVYRSMLGQPAGPT